jgi:sucrose-6-phosphate hydrolase SacC (GH32 family)
LARVAGQLRLVQQPVSALKSLRGESHRYRHLELNDGVHQLPEGERLEIRASFRPGTADTFGLRLGGVTIGYDPTHGSLYVDRTKSGNVDFHPEFAGLHRAPLGLHDGLVVLRILVDTASIEVFGGIGESVITDQIFPDPGSRPIEMFAENGTAYVEELCLTALDGTSVLGS